jgi:hypothetical protein
MQHDAERIFEVVADELDWLVRDNSGRYATRHATRDEAIREAQRIAVASQPCRLVVTTAAGTIVYYVNLGQDKLPRAQK